VLPGNQQSDSPVSGRWHSLSVSTPLVVHIIKTSQFRCHLASRPGGSAAPVLSPVLTMSAADPCRCSAHKPTCAEHLRRDPDWCPARWVHRRRLCACRRGQRRGGERELVGGECSYWACIPSKAMLRPVVAVSDARRGAGRSPGRWTLRRSAPVATDGGRLERRGAGRRAERPRRRTDPRARPAGRPPGRRGHPGRRDGGPDRPARGRAVRRPCPNWPPRRAPGPTGTPSTPAPCPDG